MEYKHSPSELHELSSESGGSDPGSDWDDLEGALDFEETDCKFSNLSLRNKAKARIVEGKGLDTETDPEVQAITAPSLDEANVEKVEKIIKLGLLEKLKVEECKLYLRKNGLRLTGNKDVLIQRIKEHLEITNGGGEKKYPPSSFVLNCKGDACTGDVVLFEQNVYEMFNIASRSASGPPCGKRTVAGRIVKESYGAAKQQHTFTIEVLWSKGEKPLSPFHPLLIKGRNLYRFTTLRQKWEDEGKRRKILMEKHSRGSVVRAHREARIQEKERRKTNMENRVSKKDSVRNQYQSRSDRPTSHCHPQETDTSINQEKPAVVNVCRARKECQSAAVTEQCGKSVGPKRVAVGSDQLGKSIDSGKTSFSVHHLPDQHAWKRLADRRGTFDVDHVRKDELSANYICPDFHSREKPTVIGKYHPFNAETNRFKERTRHRKPLTSANHFLPLMSNGEIYKQKQLCRHYARGRCYFGDNCKFIHD